MPTSSKFSLKNAFIDLLEVLFIGGVIFFLVWLFLAELVEVTGDSMSPTLKNKEQVLIEKISLNFGEIKRGDIIVFESPDQNNKYLIKRVIALPNESFELKDGIVYINDKSVSEAYIDGAITEGKKAIPSNTVVELDANSYILLGDNRENSSDSREFGPVSKDKILGKAVMVYFPFENLRFIDHVDFLLSFRMVNKLNNAVYF